MRRINELASKYLKLYIDENTSKYDVEDDSSFANECFELGFKMDCGEEFISKYSNEAFLYSDEFSKVIEDISDVQLLCNVIFSKWRQITHWDYDASVLDEDNREWFIMAFEKLSKLTIEKRRDI